MTRRVDRRQALASLGTVSLGAVLAACGEDGGGERSTAVTTSQGGTATVQPKAGASGIGAERFDAAATCALTPESAAGPYYFDADSIRSDIREDRDGSPLRLGLRVRDAASCEPIENAVVDVWHCDAAGVYSGFEAASRGAAGAGRSDDERFLRGAQATNGEGIAVFRTVYPGAYPGRAVHVHVKVHLDRRTLLTTQLYFDEATTERVHARAPYDAGAQRTTNDTDGLFDERLVLTLSREGDGHLGLLTLDARRA